MTIWSLSSWIHILHYCHYFMKTFHIMFINFSMLLPTLIFIFKGCIINFISDVITLVTTSSLVNHWGSFPLFCIIECCWENPHAFSFASTWFFLEWNHWLIVRASLCFCSIFTLLSKRVYQCTKSPTKYFSHLHTFWICSLLYAHVLHISQL